MKPFSISGKPIGQGFPCFIIAEAGVNHNGDPDMANALVDVAADMGADAIKFQTFSADRLASPSAEMADYQKRNLQAEESQFEMLKRLELPRGIYPALIQRCRDRKITFLSSPFDEESADFLEGHGMEVFKIPSGEITNIPYLHHIAKKGKAMIISTGMATIAEIATAVDEVNLVGAPSVALLQCYSDYPASAANQNLRVISTLRHAFGVPIGFSDHTEGYAVTAAAVALGACIIEKHFTLNCNLAGPDHKASLEPDALQDMVRAIRDVESSLGDGIKEPRGPELNSRIYARKSIVADRNIPAGKALDQFDLAMRRPGAGIAPCFLNTLIGRRTAHSIAAGAIITWEDLA